MGTSSNHHHHQPTNPSVFWPALATSILLPILCGHPETIPHYDGLQYMYINLIRVLTCVLIIITSVILNNGGRFFCLLDSIEMGWKTIYTLCQRISMWCKILLRRRVQREERNPGWGILLIGVKRKECVWSGVG